MRKLIVIILPITTLLFFAAIMLSVPYFTTPRSEADDVMKYVYQTENYIQSSDWSNAHESVRKLEKAWGIVVKRVQIIEERNQIENIYVNIARIKGAVQVKDRQNSIIELCELKDHWRHLGGK